MNSASEGAIERSDEMQPVREALVSLVGWCVVVIAACVGWGAVAWLASRVLTHA